MQWRDEFVSIKGLRLHLLTSGPPDAPALLLLHGGSAHAHWWDFCAAELAEQFRVIALDLRGHGDSGHVDPPAYRLDDYVSDLTAIVDQLAIEPFHLLGHSLGGVIAAVYAAAHVPTLRSLILVDAQLRFSAVAARYMRRLASFPQLAYPDRDTALKRFRLLPTQTFAPREVIEGVGNFSFRLATNGQWVLKFDRASLSQLEPRDLLPGLAAIATPMLIVRGEHSTIVTRERLMVLRERLPNCEMAEVSAAHHHVMLDNPTGFQRIVAAFVARVS